MIRYLKNLFSKKETHFQNQKKSEQEGFINSVKEKDLSINEKIELLIKRKFGISNNEILDSNSLTIDFGCDYDDLNELIHEIEHIFNIKIQKGVFGLTVGEIKEYVKKKILNPDYIVSSENSNDYHWPLSLEQILYNEHLSGRTKAIRELLENNYKIQDDERGNPFKELINFTLKYFHGYFIENPNEAERLLRDSFPIMHVYIKRQIFDQQNEITNILPLDEQNAYDEFLIFCKKYFLNAYPDKVVRDMQIRSNFKLLRNEIIEFIEEKNDS